LALSRVTSRRVAPAIVGGKWTKKNLERCREWFRFPTLSGEHLVSLPKRDD